MEYIYILKNSSLNKVKYFCNHIHKRFFLLNNSFAGFLTVPTQWKLNDIKLSHEIESSTSDTSLGDWEII